MNRDVKKRTGTFESFDGTAIYYEVRGEGRPIVLCYGLACLINHWIHQIRYFSERYQTIVFDYRGHHRSDAPEDNANLSLEAVAKDMKLLLEHLQIKQASFWGHSFGVQVLLKYYDMFPETVANMVFINGFANNPIKGMFGIDAMPTLFHWFKEGYRKNPTLMGAMWRAAILNPLAIPVSSMVGGFNLSLTNVKDIEVYARGVASLDLDVFIAFGDAMMAYDATPVLGKITVPVLIISGAKDSITPLAYQARLHASIAGSELLRVPYGSHCTQLDLPEFVNLRAEKFMAERGYDSE